MICSDIWPKYHEWCFEIFIRKKKNWDNFEISRVVFMPNITDIYTTAHKGFVIFTCRYFNLSWNATALSPSNCRKFSCSSTTVEPRSDLNSEGNRKTFRVSGKFELSEFELSRLYWICLIVTYREYICSGMTKGLPIMASTVKINERKIGLAAWVPTLSQISCWQRSKKKRLGSKVQKRYIIMTRSRKSNSIMNKKK